MKFLLTFLFSIRLIAATSLSVTYDSVTKQVAPSNLTFIAPLTATVPTTGNAVVNKTALDAAISTNRTRAVENVAEMQSLTGLANGDVIITAGRNNAGDGGGATFYYSAASAATTNLGAVFTATGMSTGRFLWNKVGALTPQMFSAFPTLFPPKAWATVSSQFSAIGTNTFSIWTQADIPSLATMQGCPAGKWHGLMWIQNYTAGIQDDGYVSNSGIEVNYNANDFYVLLRGTDGGSSSASSASILYPLSSLSAFYSATNANIVVTRSGTNVNTYINGTLLTGGVINRGPQFANSVAVGNPVRFEIGHAADVSFSVWPAAVQRGGVFARVLAGAELTNPSIAATPAVLVTSAYTGTVPTDTTAAIQSAVDYASSIGGAEVLLEGAFRIDGTINLKQNVSLIGLGSKEGVVSNFGGQEGAIAVGPSRLFQWFEGTNNLLNIDGLTHSGDTQKYITAQTAVPNGEVYSAWTWNSLMEGFSIDQTLGFAGNSIQATYAANIRLHDLQFVNPANYMVYGYFVNQIDLSELTGGARGKGIVIYGSSDGQVSKLSYGGSNGANLFIGASAAMGVYDSKIFNAQKSIGGSATADTGTDFITQTGHQFYTGDIVTFEGTPPAPLEILTPYWVGRVSVNTFGVAMNRSNAVAGTYIDLTTTGSFSAYPAPTANVWSDYNNQLQITGSRLEESYENDVVLTRTVNSIVSNNRIFRPGLYNPVHIWSSAMLTSSTNVTIQGNLMGKRLASDGTSFGTNGISVSTNNVRIVLQGNSGEVPLPFYVDPAQDRQQVAYGMLSDKFWGFGPAHWETSGLVVESPNDAKTVTIVSRDSTNAPNIQMIRSLGTIDAPTGVTAATVLGSVQGAGYDSAGNKTSSRARLTFYAGETWTTNAQGSYADIIITPNGSTTGAATVSFYSGETDFEKLVKCNEGLTVPGTNVLTVASTNASFNGTNLFTIIGGLPKGTVTNLSVTTANGVSGTVATPTTAPAITLTLGAITPSSVTSSGVVSVPSGSAFRYNSVNVIRAITASEDYIFGSGGNLTMSGANNTIVGGSAAVSYTTGGGNTAVGTYSHYYATTASNNTVIGVSALSNDTLGSGNTAIGRDALIDQIHSAADGLGNNTAIGWKSGRGIVTGTNNTILGANVTGLAAGLSGNIILATGAGTVRAQHDGTGWAFNGTIASTGSATIGSNGTAVSRLRHGRASAMVAGVIAVADAYVTANTRIILTVYTVGGTQGFLNTGTRTASTSFTITSSSVLDTSVVDWVAFEP
jgi:hypothetical protein